MIELKIKKKWPKIYDYCKFEKIEIIEESYGIIFRRLKPKLGKIAQPYELDYYEKYFSEFVRFINGYMSMSKLLKIRYVIEHPDLFKE